jgi:DMSO/TMAO reductase YedYZ heme-binding membrane subunit
MISISQWRITGLVAIVLAAMTVFSFAGMGFTEDAIRAMVRGTARSSVTLFVLAFTASSLYSLFKSDWAKFLLKNRRYIGVSFALSHFVHLLFLILLMVYFPEDSLAKLHLIEIVLASLTYVFILLMAITSFDAPRRWLGEKHWHLLHTTGMYLVWLIFIETYSFAAMQNGIYLPLLFLLLAAMGLRVIRAIKRKSASTVSP